MCAVTSSCKTREGGVNVPCEPTRREIKPRTEWTEPRPEERLQPLVLHANELTRLVRPRKEEAPVESHKLKE